MQVAHAAEQPLLLRVAQLGNQARRSRSPDRLHLADELAAPLGQRDEDDAPVVGVGLPFDEAAVGHPAHDAGRVRQRDADLLGQS